LTTKIHSLVEGLGQLARWTLTAGQAHDLTQAHGLIQGVVTDAVVADKAFDADALIAAIQLSGAKAVIPPKSNRLIPRTFDRYQYKHRNLVERFFCRLKQFRRFATRYDKLASRFSAFIALVASFIWLA
jgi:transposase